MSNETITSDGWTRHPDGWQSPPSEPRVEQPPLPPAPAPPAYELHNTRVAALERWFSERQVALSSEIRRLEADLTHATDVAGAVTIIERAQRAEIELRATVAVRRNALDVARAAAREASERADRLPNIRQRLAEAERALKSPNTDDRANATRRLDVLRPRLAALEAEETADLERLRADEAASSMCGD